MSTTRHKLTKTEHRLLQLLANAGPTTIRFASPVVDRLVANGLACRSGLDRQVITLTRAGKERAAFLGKLASRGIGRGGRGGR